MLHAHETRGLSETWPSDRLVISVTEILGNNRQTGQASSFQSPLLIRARISESASLTDFSHLRGILSRWRQRVNLGLSSPLFLPCCSHLPVQDSARRQEQIWPYIGVLENTYTPCSLPVCAHEADD